MAIAKPVGRPSGESTPDDDAMQRTVAESLESDLDGRGHDPGRATAGELLASIDN